INAALSSPHLHGAQHCPSLSLRRGRSPNPRTCPHTCSKRFNSSHVFCLAHQRSFSGGFRSRISSGMGPERGRVQNAVLSILVLQFWNPRSVGSHSDRAYRVAVVSIARSEAIRIVSGDCNRVRRICVGLLAHRETCIQLEVGGCNFPRVDPACVVCSPYCKRRIWWERKVAGRSCVHFRRDRYLHFLFLDQDRTVDLGQFKNRDLGLLHCAPVFVEAINRAMGAAESRGGLLWAFCFWVRVFVLWFGRRSRRFRCRYSRGVGWARRLRLANAVRGAVRGLA